MEGAGVPKKKLKTMPLTSAEKSRRYRERLRQDNPEKFKYFQKKKSERSKRLYKIKTAVMTEEQKEERREKWRELNKQRGKINQNHTQVSGMSGCESYAEGSYFGDPSISSSGDQSAGPNLTGFSDMHPNSQTTDRYKRTSFDEKESPRGISKRTKDDDEDRPILWSYTSIVKKTLPFIEMIVVSENAALTKEQASLVIDAVSKTHIDWAVDATDATAVNFSTVTLFLEADRAVSFRCRNEKTVDWLKLTVRALGSLWEGCHLAVKTRKELTKRVRCALFAPIDRNSIKSNFKGDVNILICALRGWNPQYVVNNWVCYNYRRTDKGFLLIFGIPENEVIEAIIPNDRIVYYKVGSIRLKIYHPTGGYTTVWPPAGSVGWEDAAHPVERGLDIEHGPRQTRRDFGQDMDQDLTSQPNTHYFVDAPIEKKVMSEEDVGFVSLFEVKQEEDSDIGEQTEVELDAMSIKLEHQLAPMEECRSGPCLMSLFEVKEEEPSDIDEQTEVELDAMNIELEHQLASMEERRSGPSLMSLFEVKEEVPSDIDEQTEVELDAMTIKLQHQLASMEER